MNKIINFTNKRIENLKQEVMSKAVGDDVKITLFQLLDLCAEKELDEADNSSQEKA